MGAGILPVILYNGVLFFLMGRERHNNLWCDFGGRPDPGENILQTAIREGGEELNGLLGINEKLHNKVTKNYITQLNHKTYSSILFQIDYNPNLVEIFKNNNDFAETYFPNLIDNNHNGLFEKTEIKWFTIDELIQNKKNFRPYYKPIINTITYNEQNIKRSIINLNRYSYKQRK